MLGGRLVHPLKRIAHAEACSSHCCKMKMFRKSDRGFSTFLKMMEHVGYSIRYCIFHCFCLESAEASQTPDISSDSPDIFQAIRITMIQFIYIWLEK